MLFLCGFPMGSLEKIQLHDVVLMRVPSRNLCAVMSLLSGVINIC